jgi:plastocyanin
VVTISTSAFSPTPLTIAIGTTVTWKNTDSMNHTATADNSSAFKFDTGDIAAGATSGGVTFTQAGTFEYTCTYHPSMHGKITVQ